jgi:DNA mismatch repair ATPase MutS
MNLTIFLQNKYDELKRAAHDCHVRLMPEAEGYVCYGKDAETVSRHVLLKKESPSLLILPVTKVAEAVQALTTKGFSVALCDKVAVGLHGGWKTILVARIPAMGPQVAEENETDEDFA